MAIRSRKRLLLGLVYLGVLFVGVAGIYVRIRHFDGVIVIPPNRSEDVVVTPAGEAKGYVGLQRNMPLDVLPLNNRREAMRYLDARVPYHAAELPFRVSLRTIETVQEFPPRDYLELSGPDGTREVAWGIGESFEYDGTRYAMRSIRPWTGLVRHPAGAPTAVVSLGRADDWQENLVLYDEKWAYPSAELGMRFDWVQSEEAARALVETGLAAFPEGRWGVLEAGRIQWLSSLAPGSGMTLNNGAEITLLKLDPEHVFDDGATAPAILVEWKREEERAREWVRANTTNPDSRYRFESISGLDRVWLLFGWQDGSLLAALYQDGEARGSQLLLETETWQPEGTRRGIRLDQSMGSALVVQSLDEVVYEAVLQHGDKLLKLREGSRERVGTGYIRYRRAPLPAIVRYTLAFRGDNEESWETALATGESVTFEGWRFSPAAHVGGDQVAVLHAQRTAGGPAALIGIAMVVAGSFGLVIVRFRPLH